MEGKCNPSQVVIIVTAKDTLILREHSTLTYSLSRMLSSNFDGDGPKAGESFDKTILLRTLSFFLPPIRHPQLAHELYCLSQLTCHFLYETKKETQQVTTHSRMEKVRFTSPLFVFSHFNSENEQTSSKLSHFL